jgi:hypothetical protein
MDNFVRLAVKRLIVVLLIASILTLGVNEAFYRLQKDPANRTPRQVVLTIPAGTAKSVAAGEEIPAIPEEMVFVVGDVLVVNNEDVESHQLGPLWIPARASASLNLDQPMRYAYNCSFQPTSYMGLDVRTPTTFWTRIQGLILAAPATVIFLFLYSLVVYPLTPKRQAPQTRHTPEPYTREKDSTGE